MLGEQGHFAERVAMFWADVRAQQEECPIGKDTFTDEQMDSP